MSIHPRVAAIDYGERYVGVAVQDQTDAQALRFDTVDQKQTELMPWLRSFIERESIETLIIGEPLGDNGQVTQQTEQSRAIAGEIEKACANVQVLLWSESLTSQVAAENLKHAGVPATENHAEAARLILNDYLKEQQQ